MPTYKDKTKGTFFCSFYYTDPETKQKKKKKKSGFKREKDAKKFERDFLNKNEDVLKENFTFEEIAKKFLEVKRQSVRKSTLRQLDYVIKNIFIPYFEDRKISEIKTKDITEFLIFLTNREYKSNTLKRFKTTLSEIFKFAITHFNLTKNPVQNSLAIKSEISKGENFWTFEEYQSFIKFVKKPVYKIAYDFLYFGGFRIGELRALKFKDVDIRKRTVNIKKSMNQFNEVGPPKTLSSIRTVTLPEQVIFNFENYKKRIYDSSENSFIFDFSPAALNKNLNSICKKNNLKKITIHGLRHSHASFLISQNVSPKLISERLGHSTVSITLDVYSHLYNDADIKLAEKINEFLK